MRSFCDQYHERYCCIVENFLPKVPFLELCFLSRYIKERRRMPPLLTTCVVSILGSHFILARPSEEFHCYLHLLCPGEGCRGSSFICDICQHQHSDKPVQSLGFRVWLQRVMLKNIYEERAAMAKNACTEPTFGGQNIMSSGRLLIKH